MLYELEICPQLQLRRFAVRLVKKGWSLIQLVLDRCVVLTLVSVSFLFNNQTSGAWSDAVTRHKYIRMTFSLPCNRASAGTEVMKFGLPEDSETMGLMSLALSLESLSVGNGGKAEGIVILYVYKWNNLH
jgi:hypothetical protein